MELFQQRCRVINFTFQTFSKGFYAHSVDNSVAYLFCPVSQLLGHFVQRNFIPLCSNPTENVIVTLHNFHKDTVLWIKKVNRTKWYLNGTNYTLDKCVRMRISNWQKSTDISDIPSEEENELRHEIGILSPPWKCKKRCRGYIPRISLTLAYLRYQRWNPSQRIVS